MTYLTRQILVTGASLLLLSGLTYVVWNNDKNVDYPNLEMSIDLLLALAISVVFGIVSLFALFGMKKASDFIYWHNFSGTLNVFVSLILGFFLFIDAGHQTSSAINLLILPPFVLGILILGRVYMVKGLRNIQDRDVT